MYMAFHICDFTMRYTYSLSLNSNTANSSYAAPRIGRFWRVDMNQLCVVTHNKPRRPQSSVIFNETKPILPIDVQFHLRFSHCLLSWTSTNHLATQTASTGTIVKAASLSSLPSIWKQGTSDIRFSRSGSAKIKHISIQGEIGKEKRGAVYQQVRNWTVVRFSTRNTVRGKRKTAKTTPSRWKKK